MVLNVIEPAHARYIILDKDLENFLKAKFGEAHPRYDYDIEHVCDRWTFEAPEKVEEEEVLRLIDEIEARRKARARDAT